MVPVANIKEILSRVYLPHVVCYWGISERRLLCRVYLPHVGDIDHKSASCMVNIREIVDNFQKRGV